MNPVDMNAIVGERDIIFVTLDTLRYDVAMRELNAGQTPVLAGLVNAWEKRHSPGTFTYAAHHAFFAGFLPTPARPGRQPRLFATKFAGSETTTTQTCAFDEPTIVQGLAARGYRTICVGGVGFFNQQTALGCVFPDLFDEAHWSPDLGVTTMDSTKNQVKKAIERLEATDERVFLFINISALHQPNYFYVDPDDPERRDTLETHAAALRYVDGCFTPLIDAVRRRGASFWIVCSDHGTAYGEDGFEGHRLAHDVVTTVPYAHVLVDGA